MKKVSVLVFLAASFVFSSCGSAASTQSSDNITAAPTIAPELGPAEKLGKDIDITIDTVTTKIVDSSTEGKTAMGQKIDTAKKEIKELAKDTKEQAGTALQKGKATATKVIDSTKSKVKTTAVKVIDSTKSKVKAATKTIKTEAKKVIEK